MLSSNLVVDNYHPRQNKLQPPHN